MEISFSAPIKGIKNFWASLAMAIVKMRKQTFANCQEIQDSLDEFWLEAGAAGKVGNAGDGNTCKGP